MQRKLLSLIVMALIGTMCVGAQVSLDSCRNMALRNNKQIRIADEQIRKAGYEKKQATAAYLPSLDFTGMYMYNSKELSIFDSDQLLPTKTFNPQTGTYDFNLVVDPSTGVPIKTPDGSYIPSQVALIPKSAMTYDIHNVFGGAVTITQPVWMGGKIAAMNKLTRYAETIAKNLRDQKAQDVIYSVDAAYWQVVSLRAKYDLAVSYVDLLDTLSRNVTAMKEAGFATKADVLNVAVQLNSANVDLTKVENGLSLSRMALCQVCGLPVDQPIVLVDEGSVIDDASMAPADYNINDVYSRRNDLQALDLSIKAYEQKANVARSAMMPNVAIVGSYSFTNPNMFNGFKKEFDGMFSVGAMVTIPIWHWGGNYNKYRAAKSETLVKRLELEEALEKVELQARQASYKTTEAIKNYGTATSNIEKAEENLRQAQAGYREGVLSVDDVMKAQTAWLKAHSERIDAAIDVKLCNVYLAKVLGTLHN